jgi:farnesyl-diphosphate farnesyltransferase
MADLDDLLARTSRTFAATIPLLEEPLRAQVKVAYLLFRIADTLEDADLLGRDPRLALLERFGALLEGTRAEPMRLRYFVEACRSTPPTADKSYADLLQSTAAVFTALDATGPAAADIRKHLARTTRQMAGFVKRADEQGTLALRDLGDLKAYCYAVAGIVGEMLTELVCREEPSLRPDRERLEADAAAFGEGLQLVNILKDAGADKKAGRTYVPAGLDRVDVFALAEEDLLRARRYLAVLHKHPVRRGTLAFHALPIRLAVATLAAVKKNGPGAKIPREAVMSEIAAMNADLDRGGDGVA